MKSTFGIMFLLVCSCATTPYRYSDFNSGSSERSPQNYVEIRRGQPNRFLDGLGNIVAVKSKILPLNAGMNSHHVSEEALRELVQYLEKNDLMDVFVSVNEYAPRDQWQRLRENRRISAGWKYSAGVLSWLQYSILPTRVFGGDRYNPYTNTLYVNSNLPAVLIVAAAYAKDIHSRRYPGAYAVFVNDVPVLTIWRRCRAVNDALGYAQANQDWKLEEQVYYVVYPQIGAATFGEAALAATGPIAGVSGFLVGPILEVGGAGVGHVVGRTTAANRRRVVDRDRVDEEIAKGSEPESDPNHKTRDAAADSMRDRTEGEIVLTNHVDGETDSGAKRTFPVRRN